MTRRTHYRTHWLVAAVGLAALALALLAGAGTALAQDSETGNVCVRDYLAGANCTANDVRFERLSPANVVLPCGNHDNNPNTPFTTTVVFEALVSADGSPNRYDIGLFIALDGTSHDADIDPSGQVLGALGGDACYHTFLSGPQTSTPAYTVDSLPIEQPDGINDTVVDGPWWNGNTDLDGCGDMETNTAVLKTLEAITVACVDNDGDGAADVSVCSSWDNNTQTTCTDVTTAFPGTSSKCSCETVQFDFTPTALTQAGATAEGQPALPLYIPAGLAAVALLSLVVLRRRTASAPAAG
ncbi:MAG: hypothetical protein ACRDHL_02400 [Candidatus Promineifilaceae bacterium]